MTDKPPYAHVILGKRSESVRTAGGAEAYTHLTLQLWSFIPTVVIIVALVAATVWCLTTGALGFHAGRVASASFSLLALIPIVLSLSELSSWLPVRPAVR